MAVFVGFGSPYRPIRSVLAHLWLYVTGSNPLQLDPSAFCRVYAAKINSSKLASALTLVVTQSTLWIREIWSVSNRVFFFRTPRTPPPQRKRASPSPLGRPVDSKNGRKSIPTRSSWPSTRPLNKSRPRREYGRLWALLQADISAQSMCWAALGWPSDTPC